MAAAEHAIIKKVSKTTVTVGNEELPYARRLRPIIQNARGQRALYLQLGHNSHAFVQYIKKDFTFSKRSPYWARMDAWTVVAVVEHCTAYRKLPEPSGRVARFLVRLVRDSHKPAYEWLEHPRTLASDKQCPASLWGMFALEELGLVQRSDTPVVSLEEHIATMTRGMDGFMQPCLDLLLVGTPSREVASRLNIPLHAVRNVAAHAILNLRGYFPKLRQGWSVNDDGLLQRPEHPIQRNEAEAAQAFDSWVVRLGLGFALRTCSHVEPEV